MSSGPDDRDEPGAPAVEFVVGEDTTAPPTDPNDRAPVHRQRWVIAGAGAILLVFALIARHGSGSHAPRTAGTPTPVVPVQSVAASLPVVAITPSTGPVTTGCPNGDTCQQISGLPDAALEVLRGAFPEVELVRATSVIATRTSDGAEYLLSRSVLAHDSSTDIVLTVTASAPGTPVNVVRTNGTRITSHQTSYASGFQIDLIVSRATASSPESDVALPTLIGNPDLLVSG